jgi:dUTP pyrophosphatase
MNIEIKLLNDNAKIPSKSCQDDAGYDLYSSDDFFIKPMERCLVKTGICISMPSGYYGHISDRSGMALKKGAHCLGKIVDPSYRGEIGVIILNTDMYETMKIQKGDRIAQMIFKKYENVNFIESESLQQTERSDNGYGSSGN